MGLLPSPRDILQPKATRVKGEVFKVLTFGAHTMYHLSMCLWLDLREYQSSMTQEAV